MSSAREGTSSRSAAGASRGTEVAWHLEYPSGEYDAAREGAAVVDRSRRGRWRITGRDPEKILSGVLTCSIPSPAEVGEGGALRGAGVYGAVLTPKGRLVTDLRLFPRGFFGDAFLLEIAAAGIEGLRSHFGKYVPPLFARAEEVTEETGMITVLGPEAAGILDRTLPRMPWETGELKILEENAFLGLAGEENGDGVRIVRCGTPDVPAFDLVGTREALNVLGARLEKEGARPVGHRVWEILRIEGGRPAFGTDMDEETIPVEAGIHRRAIDYEKGCYTGQEVIVRIRDRGRVNWHLRGLLLGEAPPPEPGTELFEEGGEKSVGRVTSAGPSPRFGQVAGLGYVRREVEPPATLRIGSGEGEEVGVRELSDEGWCLGEEDPGRT